MVHGIWVVAVVLAVVILAFGAFTWPDAPIRQIPSGFAGKTGIPHGREDYELFKLWEKSLVVVFSFTFIVNIGAVCVRRRHQKLQGRSDD